MKIDAHNHIGKKKGVSVSVDDFIKSMDEAGIDKAVVFSFSEQIDNDYVIESVKRYPSRLFGFVTINPWSTTSEEDLEKAFSTDEIYGLKLHPVKHAYALDDHSLLDPLFKICEKHNKPILIFGGANVYSSPNMFAEMAMTFPKVNLIMAHGGQMYETTSAINVAKKYKNIYIESSSMFGIRIKKLVKKNLTDQLIFGSDTPTGDMELEMKKIESIVKDENKLNNIYSLNLMKLLKGGNSL